MSRKHLAAVAAMAVTVALAFMASATSAGTTQSRSVSAAKGATSVTQIGMVSVQFRINRFVRRGRHLYAVGTTTARFVPSAAKVGELPGAVVSKRFVARVHVGRGFASAQRICPVLDLTLGPLDLNLLGLLVHLDRVHLTITADSEGGILGRLFCSLSGHHHQAGAARKLTRIAHRSGLSTRGLRLAVPLYQTTSGSGVTGLSTSGSLSPQFLCPILDLTLGPLDLNLLGLMVHLDTVHLTIVADSEGGLLGQLLAGLLCTPPPGGGRIT